MRANRAIFAMPQNGSACHGSLRSLDSAKSASLGMTNTLIYCRGSSTSLAALFSFCRAPGEGRGTATALTRLPALPDSRTGKPDYPHWRLGGLGAGLTDLEARAPEPLATCGSARSPLVGREPHIFPSWTLLLRTAVEIPGLIPVRRNLCAWECKVTPADCACQEANTIGCIPSNDGLDAGLRCGFST